VNGQPVVQPRNFKPQRGNALVEFALAFSLLFPLLYIVFQFGYSFFIYNELNAAVREGARFASYKTYNSATASPSGSFISAVQNAVVYGDPAGGTTPVVPSLAPGNVRVTVTFASGVPAVVTVSIQNFSVNAVFTTYALNKPSVSFPYTGVYAPL